MEAALAEAARRLLDSDFRAFVEHRPFCVMVRATLERMLAAKTIDAIFREHAQRQYERDLLFSSVVEVMAQVVLQVEPTVLAAYREAADALAALQTRPRAWVAKRNVKVLDGSLFSATRRRISELRTMWDAPLPGRALVVREQRRRLVCDVFLNEDGHASERTLLPEVLATVPPKDVWIADRHFCTISFLCGIWDVQARFVIRQHGSLKGRAAGSLRKCGKDSRGQPVFEQPLEITDNRGQTRTVRRITVNLHEPTRDGDRELHILTNMTSGEASAGKIADLYAGRWTIEFVFLEMQPTLACEINSLGDPRAALFAFCIALMITNAVSMLKESLRAVHGVNTIDEEVSPYDLSPEIQKTCDGMMVQIPAPHWNVFTSMSIAQFAEQRLELARKLDLSRDPRSNRGPQKPPPDRDSDHNGGHVSTFGVLARTNAKT